MWDSGPSRADSQDARLDQSSGSISDSLLNMVLRGGGGQWWLGPVIVLSYMTSWASSV